MRMASRPKRCLSPFWPALFEARLRSNDRGMRGEVRIAACIAGTAEELVHSFIPLVSVER